MANNINFGKEEKAMCKAMYFAANHDSKFAYDSNANLHKLFPRWNQIHS